jgi:hypothetical protein
LSLGRHGYAETVEHDPAPLLAAVVVAGIGWSMLVSGVAKRQLRWRRERRRCPSCGHAISGRVCSRH